MKGCRLGKRAAVVWFKMPQDRGVKGRPLTSFPSPNAADIHVVGKISRSFMDFPSSGRRPVSIIRKAHQKSRHAASYSLRRKSSVLKSVCCMTVHPFGSAFSERSSEASARLDCKDD